MPTTEGTRQAANFKIRILGSVIFTGRAGDGTENRQAGDQMVRVGMGEGGGMGFDKGYQRIAMLSTIFYFSSSVFRIHIFQYFNNFHVIETLNIIQILNNLKN